MDSNAADYTVTLFNLRMEITDIDIIAAYLDPVRRLSSSTQLSQKTPPETYDGGSPNPHHVWKRWQTVPTTDSNP